MKFLIFIHIFISLGTLTNIILDEKLLDNTVMEFHDNLRTQPLVFISTLLLVTILLVFI